MAKEKRAASKELQLQGRFNMNNYWLLLSCCCRRNILPLLKVLRVILEGKGTQRHLCEKVTGPPTVVDPTDYEDKLGIAVKGEKCICSVCVRNKNWVGPPRIEGRNAALLCRLGIAGKQTDTHREREYRGQNVLYVLSCVIL